MSRVTTWFLIVYIRGDDAPTTVRKCKSTRRGRAEREARRFADEHGLRACHVDVSPAPVGHDLTAATITQVSE